MDALKYYILLWSYLEYLCFFIASMRKFSSGPIDLYKYSKFCSVVLMARFTVCFVKIATDMNIYEYMLFSSIYWNVRMMDLSLKSTGLLIPIFIGINLRMDLNSLRFILLLYVYFVGFAIMGILYENSWPRTVWNNYTEFIFELKRSISWWCCSPIGTRLSAGWELLARKPSPRNCEWQRFSPAIICDFNILDDPFWPRHVSSVYCVEKCETNDIWYILWLVSLLNGGRKAIKKWNCAWNETVRSFQSRGIIFITQVNGCSVYDPKYKQSKVYELEAITFPNFLVMIRYMNRLWNVDRSLKGWRIRMITAEIYFAFQLGVHVPVHTHIRLINSIRDLILDNDEDHMVVNEEEIDFPVPIAHPEIIRVRTRGKFVVHVQPRQENSAFVEGPTMLYDANTGEYSYYSTVQQLLDADPLFKRYFHAAISSSSQLDFGKNYVPIWISDRECIHGLSDDTVWRLEFKPPFKKYAAAKKIFRSNPGLRNRMTADEFLQKTGIGKMKAHFGI